MKRIFVLVLLLCLILAGCGLSPVPETSLEAPSLPVPEQPDKAALTVPGSNASPDGAVFPLLESPEGGEPTVRGPAGTVRAMTYLGLGANDPVYGDVDGDGQTELVYWCAGPTSGVNTVGICVYGLEQGWPVVKECRIYSLEWGETRLETEDGAVWLWIEPNAYHPGFGEYEAVRLPVTLQNGTLLLNGGALPESVEEWGTQEWYLYGRSFGALKENARGKVLMDCPSCYVWLQEEPVFDYEAWQYYDGTGVYVIVTDNGVTVSGVLHVKPMNDGYHIFRKGVVLIPAVEDPEALAGLTAAELTERFGPRHFQMDSAAGFEILCWFTEDGQLLTVTIQGGASFADLWDMCAGLRGKAGEVQPADSDTVVIHQDAIPTRIENEERWEGFLAAVELGEENGLTLRLIYEGGVYDLDLRYDGEVYILVDEGHVTTCKYLLVEEEDTPRPGAKYRRAVHYILSDDPDLTWEQYMARMASSSVLFDQAAARSLFSVFDS